MAEGWQEAKDPDIGETYPLTNFAIADTMCTRQTRTNRRSLCPECLFVVSFSSGLRVPQSNIFTLGSK